MGDEDMETPSGEGKRLRRVACTCPNCKESGGRWDSGKIKKKEHITNTKIPGGGGVKLTFVKVKKKELTQKN